MKNQKEIWKNVIVVGKKCEYYSVSNYGNVVSHKNKRGLFDPNVRIKIRPRQKNNHSLYVSLCLPKNFFDGTPLEGVEFRKKSKNTISVEAQVHTLVITAFNPIDLNPPEKIKKEWSSLPQNVKQYISSCVYTNHIDHDPTNNHISNLEYVTPGENSRKAKQFYNGNVINKNKLHLYDPSKNENTLDRFLS